MNKEEIMNILPHRDNMLLLDEATLNEDGAACGKKHITGEEWFLKGHFPDSPIVPGVILCEILAQTMCAALPKDSCKGKTPYFTGLKNIKFKNPVRPGDTFETRCTLTKQMGPFIFAEGKGYVQGKLCISGEFSFAITN